MLAKESGAEQAIKEEKKKKKKNSTLDTLALFLFRQ
jgi:hypothetical protein